MTNTTNTTNTPDLRAALIEARDWFESQAKAVSKGCGSSYELHDLRVQRDALDAALAAPAQAAPAQAGEYPDLPKGCKARDLLKSAHVFTECDLYAAIDADRIARGAALAALKHPAVKPDMLVNGGALKLALNVLRRAGKNEVADELECTAQAAPVDAAVKPAINAGTIGHVGSGRTTLTAALGKLIAAQKGNHD